MAKENDFISKENDSMFSQKSFDDRGYFADKNRKKWKSGKSGDSMVLGLLAGAAAGLIAGILLAPDKGSETRKNLSQKGKDTVDNLKGKVNDLVDTVADKYMSGKGKSGNEEESTFGDTGLDRTRSTASHVTPGNPSSKSFT